MAAPLKTFNLHLCFLTIDGIRIEGFGEDDVITFEEAAEDVQITMGADGQKTASTLNDLGYNVTITVMENSAGTKELRRQQLEQEAEREDGGILRRPFQLKDSVSGSEVADEWTVFMNTPGPSKGKVIKSLQFKFHLPYAKRGMLLADNIDA